MRWCNVRVATMAILSVAFFLLAPIGASWASQDTNLIDSNPRSLIEDRHRVFLGLLNEPIGNSPEQTREKLRDVLSSFVDFEEIGRRSLNRHIENLTPKQRKRYTKAFKRLIQLTYLRRLKLGNHYEMTVTEAPEVRGEKAKAKTLLRTDSIEVEVDYLLMRNSSGLWRSYDIIIDGVSMVRNYRKALDKLMREKGFDVMVNRIEEKVLEKEKLLAEERGGTK